MTLDELKQYISKPRWLRGIAGATSGIEKEVRDKLTSLTSHLPNQIPASMAWHVLNNNYEIPLCPTCGKIVSWDKHYKEYNKHCSNKCTANNPETKRKKEEIALEKYGATCSFLNADQKEKRKQTNLKKYGHEQPSQSDEVKKKVRETNLERRGVEHALADPNIRAAIRETVKQKYGVDYISQVDEFKQKIKSTNLEKYGVEHTAQRHIAKTSLNILNDKDALHKLHNIDDIALDDIAIKLGVHISTVIDRFTKFNVVMKPNITSRYEKELIEFLNNNNFTVTSLSDRNILKSKELDIVLNNDKVAIEFNGIYWHSEFGGKKRNYHYYKALETIACGYDLIQIFEDEWNKNKDFIKSKLLSVLNKNDIVNYSVNHKNTGNEITISIHQNGNEISSMMGYCIEDKFIINEITQSNSLHHSLKIYKDYILKSLPIDEIEYNTNLQWGEHSALINNEFIIKDDTLPVAFHINNNQRIYVDGDIYTGNKVWDCGMRLYSFINK